MSFEQYAIPGTTLQHWTDRTNGVGWMTQAVAKTSDAAFVAIEKFSYDKQLAAVQSAFEAVGNFYKAMNLPPQADPIYVLAWSKWFGHVQPVDGALSIQQKIGQSVAGGQSGGNPPGALDESGNNISGDRFIFYQWIKYNWDRLGKPPIQSDQGICNIVIRLLLDTTGNVVTDTTQNINTHLHGPGAKCTQSGSGVEGCPTYDWNTLYWEEGQTIFSPGWSCPVAKAIPPLKWFMMFLQDVVKQINARQGLVDRTLLESFVNAAMFNASQVQKYHLANDPIFRPLMTAASGVPVDVADTVAAQQATARAIVATGTSLAAAAAAAIATAAAGVAAGSLATGPGAIVGAVIGVIGAIAAVVISVTPFAVGTDTDTFGRAEPVFQPTSLHVNGAGVPDFTVPNAPTFTPLSFTLVPGTTIDLSSIQRVSTGKKLSTFAIAAGIGYGLIKLLALKP